MLKSLSKLAAILILSVTSVASAQEPKMTSYPYSVEGGYRFADTFKVQSGDPFIFAEAGRLSGAFKFTFENGLELRAHIEGATANQVTPEGGEIFGTMQIDMGEAEGGDPSGNLLFLSYTGSIELYGFAPVVTVNGTFIGGTGRYDGASGTLSVTSINGFFDDGTGELILPAAASLPTVSTKDIK